MYVKDDYIRQSVPTERWDRFKEKCTGRDAPANQINSYLNDSCAKILEIRRALPFEDSLIFVGPGDIDDIPGILWDSLEKDPLTGLREGQESQAHNH